MSPFQLDSALISSSNIKFVICDEYDNVLYAYVEYVRRLLCENWSTYKLNEYYTYLLFPSPVLAIELVTASAIPATATVTDDIHKFYIVICINKIYIEFQIIRMEVYIIITFTLTHELYLGIYEVWCNICNLLFWILSELKWYKATYNDPYEKSIRDPYDTTITSCRAKEKNCLCIWTPNGEWRSFQDSLCLLQSSPILLRLHTDIDSTLWE